MPPISVMIKPASSGCNLRCAYCFYADEAALRGVPNYGIMSDATLETVIRTFLQAASGSCSFAFQGGEPTLAGLDFFRRVVELQKKYARPGLSVTNALQTNGVLLDEEWCRFLAQENFLVGLSLDGVKDTHDLYRRTPADTGSYAAVLRAAQRLDAAKASFNILTVVTAPLAKNITKVYNFYKKNGWLYHQYIPCMDPLADERGGESYSLTPAAYTEFLKRLFDLWYQDVSRGFLVSVRYFDNLMQIMQGRPPESCAMTGQCNVQYLVESNGNVYPCDFYAMDEYYLGNICTDTVAQLDAARTAMQFVEDSREKPAQCKECKWFGLCRGGCRRDYTGGADSHNYYCESYRAFFEYAYPRLRQAAMLLRGLYR